MRGYLLGALCGQVFNWTVLNDKGGVGLFVAVALILVVNLVRTAQ